MVTFLSSWVKNLSLALIVVSILEMILPNNKTKKYIKTIMSLYILFSIISPFLKGDINFNISDMNISSYTENIVETTSRETINQESMDNRIQKLYIQELEKDITNKIEQKGYIVLDCKVAVEGIEDNSNIKSITLKIREKIDINQEENAEEETNEEKDSMENILVKEIQKIKIQVSDNEQGNNRTNNQDINNNNTNITKTDIKIIKKFLIEEYGVSEKCLKIS